MCYATRKRLLPQEIPPFALGVGERFWIIGQKHLPPQGRLEVFLDHPEQQSMALLQGNSNPKTGLYWLHGHLSFQGRERPQNLILQVEQNGIRRTQRVPLEFSPYRGLVDRLSQDLRFEIQTLMLGCIPSERADVPLSDWYALVTALASPPERVSLDPGSECLYLSLTINNTHQRGTGTSVSLRRFGAPERIAEAQNVVGLVLGQHLHLLIPAPSPDTDGWVIEGELFASQVVSYKAPARHRRAKSRDQWVEAWSGDSLLLRGYLRHRANAIIKRSRQSEEEHALPAGVTWKTLMTPKGWFEVFGESRTSLPEGAVLEYQIDGQPYPEGISCVLKPNPESEPGHFTNRLELPEAVFDGQEHWIEAFLRIDEKNPAIPVGPPISIQSRYLGGLVSCEAGRVEGHLVNSAAPERPIDVEVLLNGKAVASATTRDPQKSSSESSQKERGYFTATWHSTLGAFDAQMLEVRVKQHPEILMDRKHAVVPVGSVLPLLSQIARTLAESDEESEMLDGVPITEAAREWVRIELLGKMQSMIRKQGRFPSIGGLPVSSGLDLPASLRQDPVIDVVVPVYGNRESVFRCLTRVLFLSSTAPLHLVVVNDASPDPELNRSLREWASQLGFSLIENSDNLGFPGAANRGMRLHPDRDVVLLNSDTIVAEGWVDRLRAAAYSRARIASVTPFSNNATILSFPRFCRENSLPDDTEVASLDRQFSVLNREIRIEIPTAVGFCMYIPRPALREVGYFDEATWGKGYGEENDFCMRARTLGWTHWAACDVYVGHEGGGSFKASTKSLLERNLETLGAKYPDYFHLVESFINKDPLRTARRNVLREALKEIPRPFFLYILHGLGGGTLKAARDLAGELLEQGVEVLELATSSVNGFLLRWGSDDFQMVYHRNEWAALIEDLKSLGIRHVHYHQTMHFPARVWDLPGILGVSYDFTLHDYLPLCPRINLIDESGRFCGDHRHNPEVCDGCIKINGLEHDQDTLFHEIGETVTHWRSSYRQWLGKARRLFVPSQSAADLLLEEMALSNVVVVPHREMPVQIVSGPTGKDSSRIIVLGAIGPHKGYVQLLNCARDALKRQLDLHFEVIGFTMDDSALEALGNVTIQGAYTTETLPEQVQASGGTIALFLSPWPETYSYTLSEAWSLGLYPVALDIGAVGERIRNAGHGHLLPLDSTASRINDALMAIRKEAPWKESAINPSPPAPEGNVLEQYYEIRF